MQIEQSIEELQALLEEQLQFIDASCRAYDAGFAGEVKRLAVSVRVLVHDTKASTSLLKLLDHKSIDFVDTSVPYEEENLASHSSLVTVILGRSGSYPAPLLDDGPFFRRVNFEAWWNGIVFVSVSNLPITANSLIGFLSVFDGIHLD